MDINNNHESSTSASNSRQSGGSDSSKHRHHHHRHHHSRSYEEHLARRRKEKQRARRKKMLAIMAIVMATLAAFIIALALFCPEMLRKVAATESVKPAAAAYTPLQYDGIDVSHRQELINWKQVAYDANIKFVYIKATEGNSIVDKQYAHNAASAAKVNVPFGAYHYLTSHSTAREQFDNFSSTASRVDQVLKPMVRIEADGVRGWTREQIQSHLAEMLRLVAEYYRCQPLIGCTAQFYNENLAHRFDHYQLFLIDYSDSEPLVDGAGDHDIHQQPAESPVKGINTPVHLNTFSEGTTIDDLYISNVKEH